MDACERQQYRFRGTGLRFNSDMGAADLEKFCPLGQKEKACLRDLFESEAMSVRAYHRIIRVARTIADLEGAERIREEHIYLAYTYRQGDLLQFKR
jgi:magnesium chelatase family protein